MSAPDRPTREQVDRIAAVRDATAAAQDPAAVAEVVRYAREYLDGNESVRPAQWSVAVLLAALAARTPQPAERAPLDVSGPLIVGAAGVPIDAYDAIDLLASRDDDFPARLLASRARTVADFWNDPPNAWQKVAATSEFPELADALDQLLDGGPGDLTDVRPAVPAPLPAVPDGEDGPSFCACTDKCGGVAVDPTCPIAQAKQRAGEDVPARLDAAADAMKAADPGLISSPKELRQVAEVLRRWVSPEVRAAVAAALAARPTEQQK